jgi:prepilin-type N-terminal cleavage/methylation domain-containing protein
MINNKKIKQQGFSLMELMIVMAIISTLTVAVSMMQ